MALKKVEASGDAGDWVLNCPKIEGMDIALINCQKCQFHGGFGGKYERSINHPQYGNVKVIWQSTIVCNK